MTLTLLLVTTVEWADKYLMMDLQTESCSSSAIYVELWNHPAGLTEAGPYTAPPGQKRHTILACVLRHAVNDIVRVAK
jgi:hypothetical protein